MKRSANTAGPHAWTGKTRKTRSAAPRRYAVRPARSASATLTGVPPNSHANSLATQSELPVAEK